MFQNLFNSDADALPGSFHLVVELQSNGILKNMYKKLNLMKFYTLLSSEQFLKLKQFAHRYI